MKFISHLIIISTVILLFANISSSLIHINDIFNFLSGNAIRDNKIVTSFFESWNYYKMMYDKIFVSKEEELKRIELFAEKIYDVMNHNFKYERGETLYSKELNAFADVTDYEFYKNYCGLKVSNQVKERRKTSSKSFNLLKEHEEEEFKFDQADFSKVQVPDNWDWRRYGIVGPPKNQYSCGACWAFSACSALESHYSKMKLLNKNRNFIHNQHSVIDLSEQALIDCSSRNGEPGCDGGFMTDAYKFVTDNGIPEEQYYKYTKNNATCKYKGNSLIKSPIEMIGYREIKPYDCEQLKEAVYRFGPVSTAIHVTQNLIMYRSGIFEDSSCPKDQNDVNHAVTIVGYGITNDEKRIKYWIVLNNWGERWGEKGYFRLKMQDNHCNICSMASYPLIKGQFETDEMSAMFWRKLKIRYEDYYCNC